MPDVNCNNVTIPKICCSNVVYGLTASSLPFYICSLQTAMTRRGGNNLNCKKTKADNVLLLPLLNAFLKPLRK